LAVARLVISTDAGGRYGVVMRLSQCHSGKKWNLMTEGDLRKTY